MNDLDEAIYAWQQVVKGTPADSPQLSTRLNNLGCGLRYRYENPGRLEDLEEVEWIKVQRTD